jgi:hypothetical protein
LSGKSNVTPTNRKDPNKLYTCSKNAQRPPRKCGGQIDTQHNVGKMLFIINLSKESVCCSYYTHAGSYFGIITK